MLWVSASACSVAMRILKASKFLMYSFRALSMLSLFSKNIGHHIWASLFAKRTVEAKPVLAKSNIFNF